MVAEQKTSASAIEDLRSRLEELERLKETQESTIQVNEQEKTVAHYQIKVSISYCSRYL